MSRTDDPRYSGRFDRVVLAVAALTLLALAARLVGLGARPFHWDEGRVGYWTLRFLQSGFFEYRPVAGGPFLYVVNRPIFALLGASDATARLVVAVIGGLLPLSALLFRSRLRDDETVVLAGILALSPTFVYYSRFLRGDLPLVAFGLVAVGAAVRTIDTGKRRYLYLSATAFALSLTTSGFAVATVACWLVAAFLVFDHARIYGEDRETVFRRVDALSDHLREWATPLARAFLVVVAVVFFFYAPRSGSQSGPGLWKPATLPAVVESAFYGSFRKFWGVRVEYRPGHPLLDFVAGYVELLAVVALPLFALGLLGILVDRYGSRNRPLVAFCTYWGAASLLVFPIVAERIAPWVLLHVLAPLAIPAAVAVAMVVRYGQRALSRRDAAGTGVAALVLCALVVQAGAVTTADVYGPSDRDNRLAQYAQPSDDLEPLAENASAAIAGHDGVDVVYVGEDTYVTSDNRFPPIAVNWGNRLPLPWYFERIGATSSSVQNPKQLANQSIQPPVVVADPQYRATLSEQLPGYRATEYHLALWNRKVVVFVRQ